MNDKKSNISPSTPKTGVHNTHDSKKGASVQKSFTTSNVPNKIGKPKPGGGG
ncbi:hypothetical protein AB4Z34_07450 [Ensifer sp. 2YAB10]|uniref:hypothetical protein n=1 Tax=unclassified Ensifer TaxID=2633371 RepID=UPI003F902A30